MIKKKALVLGATGMVGRPLAIALLEDGWQVYAAARFRNSEPLETLVPPGCHPIRFDVMDDDPASLPEVDTVFLEVWNPARPELTWAVNFYGVGRVVERFAGVADIVNGSTINVYGDQPTAPDEDSPCRPTSDYGHSRFAQEKIIDYFSVRGGKKGIHVRYAHANSPTRGMILGMAESILAGKSLGPNPDSRVQVIALEDFVRVTIQAVERITCPPTAVNCCHPRVWTRRELAEEIYKRLGRGKIVFDGSGGVEHSVYADEARMVAWFGEPQVSPETLIDRVVRGLSK